MVNYQQKLCLNNSDQRIINCSRNSITIFESVSGRIVVIRQTIIIQPVLVNNRNSEQSGFFFPYFLPGISLVRWYGLSEQLSVI